MERRDNEGSARPPRDATAVSREELVRECERLRQADQQQRAELDELRSEVGLYRLACAHAPDYMSMVDRQRRFLWANHAHPALSMEQVLESRIDDFEDPENIEKVRLAIDEAFETRGPVRYRAHYRVDGQEGWSDVRGVYLEARDALLLTTTDVTEQQQTARELATTQERLEAAQRIAGLGHWEWRVGTTEGYWSPLMYEIFGRSPESHRPSLDAYLEALPEDEREPTEQLVRRALETGEPYEIEHRLRSASGEERIVVCHGEAVRDASGGIYLLRGSAQDVTVIRRMEEELRASLATQTLLLREVHHRVKNNLQVIASLLALQAMELDEPRVRDALESSRSRVHAMALIHDVLHRRESQSRVPFRGLLDRLAQQLRVSLGDPSMHVIDLDGVAELELSLDQGIPCGLIVNELVSNAFKHGLVAGRPGILRLSLRRLDAGAAELVVADDGVGLQPDGAGGDGLGLSVVRTLVQQLEGTQQIESGDQGTVARIEFPLET